MSKLRTFTAKDFILEWYSGTGPGGQKRNKVKACCRITHIETGIKVQSTEHRSRVANQEAAFTKLAELVIAHYKALEAPSRDISNETIRTYHAVRNEVKDHASGHTQLFSDATDDLNDMITKRKEALE